MELSLCAQDDYEVKTVDQAYLFIIFDIIVALCEILFIYKNIRMLRKDKTSIDTWELMCFYLAMHLVFIRTCLFLLGGSIICYPKLIYHLLETYCFIFKRVGLFLLCYRMVKLLRQMKIEEKSSMLEKIVLILCLLDIITFSILDWLGIYFEIIPINASIFYSYVILMECILTTIFIIAARGFTNSMHGKMPSYKLQRLLWIVFSVIIVITFLVRTAQAGFNIVIGGDNHKKITKNILFAFYQALYITITEIIPSLLMIWISSQSTEESLQKDESLFSSSAISYSDS